MAPLPPWMRALLDEGNRSSLDTAPTERIPRGARNSTLMSLGGTMHRRGMTSGAIEAALLAENELRCDPPLSKAEIGRIVRSVTSYPPGEGKGVSGDDRTRTACLVRLSDVASEEVTFLWHPYLPRGKVTLLEGDPDLGKTFICLAFAAAVTRGWPLPDEDGVPREPREAANVLFFTAEDGLGDTLRPRLDAMGGDPSRLLAVTGMRSSDGEESLGLTLHDRDVLKDAFCRTKPVLAVFDPLFAYLGANTDAHRANETRPLMAALALLAEQFQTAIVCVRHWRKSEAPTAIYRGVGSIDFAAAARSILVVGRDPEQENLRVLAHAKSNLAPKGHSQAYELTTDGEFRWAGRSGYNAEELLVAHAQGKENKREQATEFLEDLLAPGPLPAEKVYDFGKKAGFSGRTLKRAKSDANVISKRVGKTWAWALQPRGPEDHLEKVGPLDTAGEEATE